MWLLDAHNSDNAAGVSEDVFRSIFYACKQCNRYMTQRVSRDHHEDTDFEDYTCINLKPGAKNGNVAGSSKVATQPFPILEPL